MSKNTLNTLLNISLPIKIYILGVILFIIYMYVLHFLEGMGSDKRRSTNIVSKMSSNYLLSILVTIFDLPVILTWPMSLPIAYLLS